MARKAGFRFTAVVYVEVSTGLNDHRKCNVDFHRCRYRPPTPSNRCDLFDEQINDDMRCPQCLRLEKESYMKRIDK